MCIDGFLKQDAEKKTSVFEETVSAGSWMKLRNEELRTLIISR
jgi:hypothetical protein